MILHTQDAYVKLIVGERTAAQAWKKLEDNFEKKSNARVIQLRKKLTGMKLMSECAGCYAQQHEQHAAILER